MPTAECTDIAPVFPVSDIGAAAAHYRSLHFDVEAYDGAPYAFARRGACQLHLAEVAKVNPKKNMSAAYLYVTSAAELYDEWASVGHSGRDVAPTSTDYGMVEGAHLDPDGNLLRYGSAS